MPFKLSSLFTLIALLTLSVACGSHKRGEELDQNALAFSTVLDKVGNPLDEEEKAVLMRICYAYRSKHTNFRTSFLSSYFDFSTRKKNCKDEWGDEVIAQMELKLNENDHMTYDIIKATDPQDRPTEFYPSTNSFVHTHLDGHLTTTCEAAFRGSTPTDTYYHDV